MTGILLTKSNAFIIGPVSQLLGYLMNGIFTVLEKIGIPSIGLAIIIFTLVIFMYDASYGQAAEILKAFC